MNKKWWSIKMVSSSCVAPASWQAGRQACTLREYLPIVVSTEAAAAPVVPGCVSWFKVVAGAIESWLRHIVDMNVVRRFR